MGELSLLHIALTVVLALAGVVIGWLLRGKRCAQEKKAVSAGWQHQIDTQQKEHDRIAAQNTSLMEQVSQAQAAGKDTRQRAEKLSADLRDAVARHDELQGQIKSLRKDLEGALEQRDRLRSDFANRSDQHDVVAARMREKDEKIARLKTELGRWQERVPPLVERYRERDEDAKRLAEELNQAEARITELEDEASTDGTRIESMKRTPLDSLDASNDQYEETLETEGLADSAVRPANADDLKQVKGIGPAIETMLFDLGIISLRQLAELNDVDIDRIAEKLRGARTRIHREDWIGQASVLLHEMSGDQR